MSLFYQLRTYMWPQMRKYKWAFWTIILFFSLRTLFGTILTTYFFKEVVDIISSSVIRGGVLVEKLWIAAFWVLGANFLAFLFARTGSYIHGVIFEANVVRDLQNYIFQRIESNSYTFFANHFSGSLVTKSKRFVVSFAVMFEVFIYFFLRFVVTLTGVFVVLLTQSKILSSFFFIWVVVNSCFIYFFSKRKMKYDLLNAEQDSKISGRLADVFGNILAVKFFSARNQEIESFGKYTEEGANRLKKVFSYHSQINIGQGIIDLLIKGGTLYVMVYLWLQGEISTGTFVIVQTYIMIVSELLWHFIDSLVRFMKSAADMREMIDILEKAPEIKDPKKPEKIAMTKGNIAFNDVSFNYQNGKEVFENFNLNIKTGERVGLVGHSGAGKSTIVSLILRFMDINSGSITIDGQDIRSVTQDDLRSVISYVPQESILFHRSIRENIAYGKQDATSEQVIEAAKKAHADEFISKLQYGYDTLVGERGVKLSGGERQRVAIARAMLKDSPILILDEATSSLDSISEHYIQDAFNELMKGKTAIVIAHRLSTIQKMDRIIVLDGGKIVEEGTHKDLLEKNGYYAELWEHQTGGFLED